MKTKFKHLLVLTFFALLTLTSCQNEETDVTTPNSDEIIEPNSPLANLISNTSANDGAYDDFLDNASCLSIELPVTIQIGGITITIESVDDIDELEDLFDELDVDDGDFDFLFPITIILNDYTEIVIENAEQLENLVNECNDDDDAIECVDFQYPISFSVFNSDFNIIDTIIIESDEALYNFFEELEEEDNALIVSLNYPVTLKFPNGETLEVNSNQELAEAIESAGDDCDEDDNENCSEEFVAQMLVLCPWDIDDENDDFEDYEIIFNEDGTLKIIQGDTTQFIGGEWSLSSTDNGLIISFSELTAFQEDLGGEWLITECEDGELKLVKGDRVIELEKECEDDISCSLAEVNEDIKECLWEIALYSSFPEFQGIDLEFNADGSFSITQNGDTIDTESNWSLSLIGNYVYLILDTNFEDLGGDWKIIECEDERYKLIKGDQTMVLEQDCNEDEDLFECFESFDAVLELCDDGTDGPYTYDLTVAFSNCNPSADTVTYHLTQADAEAEVDPIPNPSSYVSTDVQSTIYVRVEINNQFEIFTILLKIIECNSGSCTEGDVDGILMNCQWKITSLNGDDNLVDYRLSFMGENELVITDLDTNETLTAAWTTETNSDGGVQLIFEAVSGPDIQAINGVWNVVECTGQQLVLHNINNSDNEMVIDKICD